MKIRILSWGLFILTIFTLSMVLAEEIPADVPTTESGAIGDDVEKIMGEVEAPVGQNKVGFSRVSRGHGWITNGDEGYLITGMWVSQRFAEINKERKEIESNVSFRSFGRLNILGAGSYKLVLVPGKTDKDKADFYVIPLKESISYIEDASAKSIGKLQLTRESNYSKFMKWTGSLEISSEKVEGSWDVSIGTITNIAPPKKIGFLNRLQFWKKSGSKSPSISEDELELQLKQRESFRDEREKLFGDEVIKG